MQQKKWSLLPKGWASGAAELRLLGLSARRRQSAGSATRGQLQVEINFRYQNWSDGWH